MHRCVQKGLIKSSIFTLSILSPLAYSADQNICKAYTGPKSFISHWVSDDISVDILTTIDSNDLLREDGKTHEVGDLNGDGSKDYIFESYSSEGSSRDRTYNVLIQCHGFLANAGGDYFSGFKLDENEKNLTKGEYKRIVFLAYKRAGDGSIIYNEKNPKTEPQVWEYDKEQKKYRPSKNQTK
ncbi:hypothetical protein [Pseudomonas luteola]|uniref:hypothetical protein n=1 Tax=Pseudomonas luteola TaxID=47886 RepID=UPI001239CB80|nr:MULTISPECIES: hypothetical protein [Pseudomonas]MBA1250976.1 hypothetical protein [Pseudomonas zeshuii]QEU30935.1 hypothetical protein FOB45_25545 [Pseudomonas luteola]